MVYAAELTDNVDDRFADLEVGLYAVMLERDDVRVLLCNDMREALECARCVRHENRELELTAAGDEALFYDLVDEGNVDVAAGEDADDLFALDVDLVVEHGRERSGAGGLNDLLAALEQQQDGGGDLVVGDRDNAVHVLLDIFDVSSVRQYSPAMQKELSGCPGQPRYQNSGSQSSDGSRAAEHAKPWR